MFSYCMYFEALSVMVYYNITLDVCMRKNCEQKTQTKVTSGFCNSIKSKI